MISTLSILSHSAFIVEEQSLQNSDFIAITLNCAIITILKFCPVIKKCCAMTKINWKCVACNKFMFLKQTKHCFSNSLLKYIVNQSIFHYSHNLQWAAQKKLFDISFNFLAIFTVGGFLNPMSSFTWTGIMIISMDFCRVCFCNGAMLTFVCGKLTL